MQIIIDENWAIGADKHSWQVQKAQMEKVDGGKEKFYRPVAWFASIDQAIKELAERRLRTSDCSTLADALRFNKEVLSSIVSALAPDIEVSIATKRID